ncbi:RNA polymerase sigma factor [Hymenobacter cheonanensis]|uniref:RNA polymerase sigma factor n=1 Tax=Hymenobacter sp. CA2-7 TaxID=3063993 RepID=UPI0027138F7A|nr:RNA polymerase sigma factor [Hymenobacter sp. CA2-7]MDO7885312.1 RNA polymerase sigma factor [Hymenobacter sp. CA2-7]
MKLLEPDAESQLVQRLYARDELAMAFFYKNYHRALYHTIWRVVRQEELAQDILQETMLKFWLTFPSYDKGKGRLFTWALTIARNLAIDRLRTARRTSQRTHSLTEAEVLHLAAPTGFRPEHVGVLDWLALLGPADRQLVELLYVQGYTQAEAAETLQLPLGTVKSRGRRIIRALARRIN